MQMTKGFYEINYQHVLVASNTIIRVALHEYYELYNSQTVSMVSFNAMKHDSNSPYTD
jgi:hypothetical protein